MCVQDQKLIRDTAMQMDEETFHLAVETIARGKTIYIVGVRNSAPLAQFLAFYLNIIQPGVKLISTNSASEIYEQLLHVGAKDVVIGISFPRYSMRILKAMEFANSRNAKVITITDSIHSPINLYSSCNLLAKSAMTTIMDSVTAAMSLINALIVALYMKNRKTVMDNLEELDRIWEEYPVDNHDEINRLDPEMKLTCEEEWSGEKI